MTLYYMQSEFNFLVLCFFMFMLFEPIFFPIVYCIIIYSSAFLYWVFILFPIFNFGQCFHRPLVQVSLDTCTGDSSTCVTAIALPLYYCVVFSIAININKNLTSVCIRAFYPQQFVRIIIAP